MVEAVLAHTASTADLAPSTLVEFGDVMRRFARFMERGLGITEVSVIGQAEVRAFVESRQADGGRPSLSRMHNRRTVCRYVFRNAMRLGICASDPTEGVVLPRRTPVRPRPLTDDEVEVCRSHALFHPDDLRHPVAWALAEGTARTFEIARVLVGDFDPVSGAIRLGGSPRCLPRTVSLTDWGLAQVRRRMEALPAMDEPLFPMRSKKVPRATASMAVIEVLRAAGIEAPEIRPISVVAWRGASAYADGTSIEDIAAMLGLRSLDRAAGLIGLQRLARFS
jgi:site-specific recombinase XerD